MKKNEEPCSSFLNITVEIFYLRMRPNLPPHPVHTDMTFAVNSTLNATNQ